MIIPGKKYMAQNYSIEMKNYKQAPVGHDSVQITMDGGTNHVLYDNKRCIVLGTVLCEKII